MNDFEQRIADRLVGAGWEVYRRGWPDLLCVMRDQGEKVGRVIAVEIKGPGDKVSPDQAKMHEILKAVGLPVLIGGPEMLEAQFKVRTKGRAFLEASDIEGMRREVRSVHEDLARFPRELQALKTRLGVIQQWIDGYTVLAGGRDGRLVVSFDGAGNSSIEENEDGKRKAV